MKSATSLLNIGNSGLSAARKRLTTTSHNIANANTEGFSRQRAPQQTTTPIAYGDLVLGTGTQIDRVERIHNRYLEKRLGSSLTEYAFFKERGMQLSQIETIFNEINVKGFNDSLNGFFNSFRELSKQPDNNAIRSVVRENARALVHRFQDTREQLDEVYFELDRKITGSLEEVNSLLRQIASLNTKVVSLENTGGEAGDLRDQRDLKIRELAEFFDINVYQDESGQYTVNAVGLGSLVAGASVNELSVQKSSNENPYEDGRSEIYFKERPSYLVSKKFSGGKLGALLNTRDHELKSMQKHIDDLAFSLMRSVNLIHRRGVANHRGGVMGINFFIPIDKSYGAANKINLSREVREDVNNIVTALEPDSPGDNRIALEIVRLQHLKMLDGGSSTFETFYLKELGRIGSVLKEVQVSEEYSQGILAQNKALRESVSGVSIDEEVADMIRFQHAFDASARVMSVADEMFQTVLGIKKL